MKTIETNVDNSQHVIGNLSLNYQSNDKSVNKQQQGEDTSNFMKNSTIIEFMNLPQQSTQHKA